MGAVQRHAPGCTACAPAVATCIPDFPKTNLVLNYKYLALTVVYEQFGATASQAHYTCEEKSLRIPLTRSVVNGFDRYTSAITIINDHPTYQYHYPAGFLNPYIDSGCHYWDQHKWIVACGAAGGSWSIIHQIQQAGGSLIDWLVRNLVTATFVASPFYAEFDTPAALCPADPPLNENLVYCYGERQHVVTQT